ncbi:MAG: hypothetical protein V4772_03790 [Pseudomonadota bacterium]
MKDQTLSSGQVLQLTRAMLSVALVDGLQDAESALISQFYQSSSSAGMPAAEAVLASTATAFKLEELAGSDAAFADTLVLMCLMTAYADGHMSDTEREHVQLIADAAGVDAVRFEGHLAQVRDELTAALSHLPDAGSVAAVVREM